MYALFPIELFMHIAHIKSIHQICGNHVLSNTLSNTVLYEICNVQFNASTQGTSY